MQAKGTEYMDLKLDREKLVCSVVSSEEEISQTAEHDFLLPDYCPDVFRVLKCQMIPGIVSTGINGGKLTFELNVIIRVLYRSADGGGIFSVEQSLDFSRTAELSSDVCDPVVRIIPSVQSVNCIVANQRRLTVRGNVVCKVKTETKKCFEAVCGAYGSGIQLKTAPVAFPAKRFVSAKRITVIEELELASGKPPFGSLLRSSASVRKGEQKIVMGKLITKGEADIDILYIPKDSDEAPPEAMSFSIPFSQISDADGIDEECDVEAEIVPSKCSVMAKQGTDGELECELVLLVNVTAEKYKTCELATDAYSTMYETELETLPEIPGLFSKKISAPVFAETGLKFTDGEAGQIYDLWTEGVSGSVRYDEASGVHTLYGKATFCMLGRLTDGSPAYAEKEVAFEQPVEPDPDGGAYGCGAVRISADKTSYTICEDGSVKAGCTLEASVELDRSSGVPLLSGIRIDEDKPKKCKSRCAVKICYSRKEESLWDIAKKYSTSAQAISEETPVEDADGRRILIIPIRN